MTSQQLTNAESIARRMATATTGLDAAEWLLAATLLRIAQSPEIPKNGKLPHNESTEDKTLIIVR